MDVLDGYRERSTVVSSQYKQLRWLMEDTLHQGWGRSWALCYTPNLAGVERKMNTKDSI
jgi:hypothetical protein